MICRSGKGMPVAGLVGCASIINRVIVKGCRSY